MLSLVIAEAITSIVSSQILCLKHLGRWTEQSMLVQRVRIYISSCYDWISRLGLVDPYYSMNRSISCQSRLAHLIGCDKVIVDRV